jgi:hypothetical protein
MDPDPFLICVFVVFLIRALLILVAAAVAAAGSAIQESHPSDHMKRCTVQ